MRNGEKIVEEMITETDALHTYDCGDYFVINPAFTKWDKKEWCSVFDAERVKDGFNYNSSTTKRLTIQELKDKINEYRNTRD